MCTQNLLTATCKVVVNQLAAIIDQNLQHFRWQLFVSCYGKWQETRCYHMLDTNARHVEILLWAVLSSNLQCLLGLCEQLATGLEIKGTLALFV